MAKREKLFLLSIELDEVIEDESSLFTIFRSGQICSGIDQIQSTLDDFNNQLKQFIAKILIPNQKKKE